MSNRGLIHIKHDGRWAYPAEIYTKINGSWTDVKQAYIKQNGEWKLIFPLPSATASYDSSRLGFSLYTEESITKSISISNTGNDVLTLVDCVITQSGNFTTTFLSGPFPISIQPGESKTVSFRFDGKSPNISTSSITFKTQSIYYGMSSFSFSASGEVLERYSKLGVSPTSLSYSVYPSDDIEQKYITISNSGNKVLTIYGVLSDTNNTAIVSFPATVSPGSSKSLIIKPNSINDTGNYSDIITVNTDGGTATISIGTTVVNPPSGSQSYTSPGNYSFRVPAGVKRLNITVAGGGGGGGGSTEVGNGGAGGGGGSGGLNFATKSVTPGEYLTISVGAGGAGSPYVGRNAGASGAGGTAQSGATSQISGSFGSIIASGGSGGNSGASVGGSGGAGGSPSGSAGASGTTGTNDYSTTYGGSGGSNGSGYGTGGAGANAPDRVSPYNWAGNPGSAGAVLISW